MNRQTIPLEDHIKEVKKLNSEISLLEEQIKWFQRQIFGKKSEKVVDTQNSQQLFF